MHPALVRLVRGGQEFADVAGPDRVERVDDHDGEFGQHAQRVPVVLRGERVGVGERRGRDGQRVAVLHRGPDDTADERVSQSEAGDGGGVEHAGGSVPARAAAARRPCVAGPAARRGQERGKAVSLSARACSTEAPTSTTRSNSVTFNSRATCWPSGTTTTSRPPRPVASPWARISTVSLADPTTTGAGDDLPVVSAPVGHQGIPDHDGCVLTDRGAVSHHEERNEPLP